MDDFEYQLSATPDLWIQGYQDEDHDLHVSCYTCNDQWDVTELGSAMFLALVHRNQHERDAI